MSASTIRCADDDCSICSDPTGAVCDRAMPGMDLLRRAAGILLASASRQAGSADSAARVVDSGDETSGSF